MKVEREAYWNSVAANLEEESSREKYQTLYLILRSLSGKTKSINDVDQENVRSSGECLLRWKEFFQQLHNHDMPQGPPLEPLPIDQLENLFLDSKPTIREVRSVIR